MILRHAGWHPELVPWVTLTEAEVAGLADELVRFHAQFHAFRTALKTGSDCAIVEVDLGPESLWPDESLYYDGSVNRDQYLAAQARVVKDDRERRLRKRGTVAHAGPLVGRVASSSREVQRP